MTPNPHSSRPVAGRPWGGAAGEVVVDGGWGHVARSSAGGAVANKILIVGDDAHARDELAAALARSEVQARAVPGRRREVLVACLQQVDLIVLDVAAEETGEWDLLREVRALSAVPVIALLTAEDAQKAVQALDEGADQVMVWPVDGRELEARVGALLRRARARVRGSNGSGSQSWQRAYAVASKASREFW